MDFSDDASGARDWTGLSVLARALAVLVFGVVTYQFFWAENPYRDGAEAFIRSDAATGLIVGDIRGMTLKRTTHGSCAPTCSTYEFSVVGTRASLRVAVLATTGPAGKPQFRMAPPDQR